MLILMACIYDYCGKCGIVIQLFHSNTVSDSLVCKTLSTLALHYCKMIPCFPRNDLQESHRPSGLASVSPRPAHPPKTVPLQIHTAIPGSHWSVHPLSNGAVHQVMKYFTAGLAYLE